MNFGRRARHGKTEASPNRYTVIANGGADPLLMEASPSQGDAEARSAAPSSSTETVPEEVDADSVAATQIATENAHSEQAGFDEAAHGLEDLGEDEIDRRKQALEELLDLMRPAVQMDGGDLALVDADYHAGIIEVELQGACGSCAISSTTLKGGVERLLKERLEWVTEVHGGVDDSVDPFESAALGRGAYVPRYY